MNAPGTVAFPVNAEVRRLAEQMQEHVSAILRPQLQPLVDQLQVVDPPCAAQLREISASIQRLVLETSPKWQESMRQLNKELAKAYAPQMKDLLAHVGSSFTVPTDLLESIATTAQVDVSVPARVLDALTDDLETEAAADDEVAPLRTAPVSTLSPDQRATLGRFVSRWGENFGIDVTVLGYTFGEAYVADVLRWSAVLAMIQVIVLMVVIRPYESGR